MNQLRSLPGSVRTSADGWGYGLYSVDDRYRYWFLTQVDPRHRPGSVVGIHRNGVPVVDEHTLVWVGLNPSKSDDNGANRATLNTVVHWAKRAGLTQVIGVNLYAFRETNPELIRQDLRTGRLNEVIGEGNDLLLTHLAARAGHVLLAWGSDGALGGRGQSVASWFPQGECVGRCKNGEPWHPGRKPRSLLFSPFAAASH